MALAPELDRRPSAAQSDWLKRVLGFAFDDGEPAPPLVTPQPPTSRKPAAKPAPELKGMALWQAERAKAVAALRQLEAAMDETDHPERTAAVILVRAVRANLTEVPATLAQVEELQRYLDADDVVDAAETPNEFGVTVALREPLGRALASLRESLQAGETQA